MKAGGGFLFFLKERGSWFGGSEEAGWDGVVDSFRGDWKVTPCITLGADKNPMYLYHQAM